MFFKLRSFFLLLICLFTFACSSEKSNQSNQTQNLILLPKNQIDLLFVWNTHINMKEEIKRFADQFSVLSETLINESKDFRIAVISSQILNQSRGKWIDPQHDLDGSVENCEQFPSILNAQDIYAYSVDELTEIVGSQIPSCARDDDSCILKFYQKAYLNQAMACFASVKLVEDVLDKGLESMRLALSCHGPNEAQIDPCCIGLGNERTFDPNCTEATPFLRPTATLVIAHLSDRNDCSHPADAGAFSQRLVCRPDGLIDQNQNQVPDLYEQFHENLMSAQTAYHQDCEGFDSPLLCQSRQCVFEVNSEIQCEQNQANLSDISVFADFLRTLKSSADQMIYAPFVNFNLYQDLKPLQYTQADDYLTASCSTQTTIDACCMDGICPKVERFKSCDLGTKALSAYPGTRYLKLAEQMAFNEESLVTCHAGNEPKLNELSKQYFEQAGKNCLHICLESYEIPFNKLKDQISSQSTTYCLTEELKMVDFSLQSTCGDECQTADQMSSLLQWEKVDGNEHCPLAIVFPTPLENPVEVIK
jgi:hypothetical protein